MSTKNVQQLAEIYISTYSDRDFTELYKRIKPGLLNHCRSILFEKEKAEDAVSNTITKILTKIGQYDPGRGNFSTWIYNIARNESLVIKKGECKYLPIINEINKNNSDFDDNDTNITIEPFYGVSYNEITSNIDDLYENVLEKMKELPAIYKEILYDREILKMRYQEIADKYNMKKRAVATRIRRARIKIREMFPDSELIFID